MWQEIKTAARIPPLHTNDLLQGDGVSNKGLLDQFCHYKLSKTRMLIEITCLCVRVTAVVVMKAGLGHPSGRQNGVTPLVFTWHLSAHQEFLEALVSNHRLSKTSILSERLFWFKWCYHGTHGYVLVLLWELSKLNWSLFMSL